MPQRNGGGGQNKTLEYCAHSVFVQPVQPAVRAGTANVVREPAVEKFARTWMSSVGVKCKGFGAWSVPLQ